MVLSIAEPKNATGVSGEYIPPLHVGGQICANAVSFLGCMRLVCTNSMSWCISTLISIQTPILQLVFMIYKYISTLINYNLLLAIANH